MTLSDEDEADLGRIARERGMFRVLLIEARECLRDQLKAASYKNEVYMMRVFQKIDRVLNKNQERGEE